MRRAILFAVLALAAPALAKSKPKAGFEPALPAPLPAPRLRRPIDLHRLPARFRGASRQRGARPMIADYSVAELTGLIPSLRERLADLGRYL